MSLILKVNDVVIAEVTSDELEDAPGTDDGSTLNDIVIAPLCQSLPNRWPDQLLDLLAQPQNCKAPPSRNCQYSECKR